MSGDLKNLSVLELRIALASVQILTESAFAVAVPVLVSSSAANPGDGSGENNLEGPVSLSEMTPGFSGKCHSV